MGAGKGEIMLLKSYDIRLNEDKTTKLVEVGSMEYVAEHTGFTRPEYIAEMMKSVFDVDNLATEHVYVLAMNSKNRIIGIFELSAGTMDTTVLGTRELFQRLLLIGAVQFVVIHNHCSGDTEPSKVDLKTTAQIEDASKLLGINFIDHIIVGTEGYYSMAEHDIMNC